MRRSISALGILLLQSRSAFSCSSSLGVPAVWRRLCVVYGIRDRLLTPKQRSDGPITVTQETSWPGMRALRRWARGRLFLAQLPPGWPLAKRKLSPFWLGSFIRLYASGLGGRSGQEDHPRGQPVRPVSTPRPSPIKSATSVFQSRSTWTWTNDAEDAVALEHETGNGRERGGTMNGSQRYGCAVPSPTDSPWVPLPHTCSTRTPPPRSSS